MTRKRFVKLAMSCGYDRDHAKVRANADILTYGSYQKAWEKSYDLVAIHACREFINAIELGFCRVLKQLVQDVKPLLEIAGFMNTDGSENYDGSYAGGSPEVDKANPCGNEECGDKEE